MLVFKSYNRPNLFCSRCGKEWFSVEYAQDGDLPAKCPLCFQNSVKAIPNDYMGIRPIALKIIAFPHTLKTYYVENHESFLDIYDRLKVVAKILVFLSVIIVIFYLMLQNIKIE